MVKLDYARLKNIRLEQDITQKELATATGVNLSTIKQIETGRSATDLENIEKLCAYLEVDINEIYHPDYHDTKVLCMLNNKGGCGKTSLCSGIATSMAELGLRILVIDGDGQRNLSSSFDMPRSEKNFGAAVLRAVGDTRRPLYFLIAACLTNIVLDVLFVVVLPVHDVKGVAIATSLSQVVSAILVCASLMRTKECYRLELKKLRTNLKLLGQTIRIGLPTGLQSIMYAVSNIIITTSINTFETDAVAAWVTLSKVDAMNWMIVNAFGIAVMTFVGQNYGAGRYDRVRRSMKTCLMMAMGTSILFGAVFALFGRTLFGLFNKDEDVLKLAVLMMMYMAPSYWLYGPIEIISGSLRGMGDTLIPTIITAVGICALRVVWLLLVVPAKHEIGMVCVSYPISWALTFLTHLVCLVIMMRRLYRREGIVSKHHHLTHRHTA